MRTAFKRSLGMLALAAFSLVGSSAHAGVISGFDLYLTDGTNWVLVDDQNGAATPTVTSSGSTVGAATFSAAGNTESLVFSGTIGTTTVTIDSALSIAQPGAVTIDLSTTASALAGTTLYVAAAINNQVLDSSPGTTILSMNSGGTLPTGDTITATGALNPSNPAPPFFTTPAAPTWAGYTTVTGTATGPGYSIPNTATTVGVTGPFALGAENAITWGATGLVSADTTVFAAPEPATLAILASTLPLIGVSALRRRRKTAAAA